jgi:hypothetical protein
MAHLYIIKYIHKKRYTGEPSNNYKKSINKNYYFYERLYNRYIDSNIKSIFYNITVSNRIVYYYNNDIVFTDILHIK